jgi:hypothetical protein
MTLGRPPITSGQSDVPLPMAIDDDAINSISADISQRNMNPPLLGFFVEGVKLYKILAEILTDVYKPWSLSSGRKQINQQLRNNSFDTIIKLDCKLSDFDAGIPDELHWSRRERDSHHLSEIADRQSNVLHARLVVLPYFLLFDGC